MRNLLKVLVIALVYFAISISINAKEDKPTSENDIQKFFKTSNYDHFRISPNGELIAYSESLKEEYNIYLYNVATAKSYKVHTALRYTDEAIKSEHYIKWVEHDNRIAGIFWLGEDVISVRENTKDGFRRLKIIRLDIDDDGITQEKESYLNQNGYWADPLINSRKSAIFAKERGNDDYDYHVDLFKINLTKTNLDGQTRNKKRVNKKGPKLQEWLIDNKGHRAAGTRTKNNVTELYVRTGKKVKKYKWDLAWTGKESDYMEPVLYDNDNKVLYVITNAGTDKKVLRKFDTATNKLSDIVYAHPKYDVRSGILSADETSIIGVSFIENGFYTQEYFKDQDKQYTQRLNKKANVDNSYILDIASLNNNRVLKVSDSNNSGELYIYNAKSDNFTSIIELKPWLKGTQLQKSKLITLTTEDNSQLEAFITLPTNVKKAPLLVIPHGGPIGVSNSRHYSAEIQVLVDAGFATLQVNYRGSAGYGKKFKQQGMGQWGELIEDDIELALNHAKANFAVDPEKVCIIGGSYGGYSAIFSIIRSPQLYQCAASFAGVTDLALMFQRSDIENDDDIQKQLRQIVGDPDKEQDKLFQHSPIYRASEITTPLFIAHGTDDEVVDIEHAYRLKFALKAHKIPFKWTVLDGFKHGFENTAQAEYYYTQLITFLNKHLKD